MNSKSKFRRLSIMPTTLALALAVNLGYAGDANDIVGMAIAKNSGHTFAWYRNGSVSSGVSNLLGKHRSEYRFAMPPGVAFNDIVGMAIAQDSGHVFAWYRDGTVSSGSSDRLDKYRKRYQYVLPQGKRPHDIVGMAIAPDTGYVHAWYRDGTTSSGTSDHLDRHRKNYRYTLPQHKKPTDIVGMAMSKKKSQAPGIAYGTPAFMTFAWYRDGTVSAGTSNDLGKYRAPYPYVVPGQSR